MKEITYEQIVKATEGSIESIKQEIKQLNETRSMSNDKIGRLAMLEINLNYHEMVKVACEKQVAWEPDLRGNKDGIFNDCPECGFVIKDYLEKPNYCKNCGKKLEWKEEKK